METVDAKFIERFIIGLSKLCPSGAPKIEAFLITTWLNQLANFQQTDLSAGFGKLAKNKFFPSLGEVFDVISICKIGKSDEGRFAELCEIIDQYKLNNGDHNTTDEIMARAIDRITNGGGIPYCAKWWRREEYLLRKKEFEEIYRDERLKHFEGAYNNSPRPIVGNRLATAIGGSNDSETLCIEAEEIAIEEETTVPKFDLTAFRKSLGTPAPSEKERLDFKSRISKHIQDEGMSSDEQDVNPDAMTELQILALEQTMAGNPHTTGRSFDGVPDNFKNRGWFKVRHSRVVPYEFFAHYQDPLYDPPVGSIMTMEQNRQSQIEGLRTVEEREVYRVKQSRL